MKATAVELGFLAVPGGGALPGVVMIHDVWGLSDHTRDYAGRLAREGFAVLAIDLYRRARPEKIEDPGAWMRALSDPQVLSDLGAGARWLAALPETNGRVGVLGFCMGGMYALMAGCADLGFSASVPFYGLLSHAHGLLHDPAGLDPARKPREPIAMAAELRCPLLAFFGDRDAFVPIGDVRALERELARSRVGAEVVVVPGAGHAFMNDTRPDAYLPEAAAMAWRRTVDFLHAQLGGSARRP
jgi:carboxymethylenebutenolidase